MTNKKVGLGLFRIGSLTISLGLLAFSSYAYLGKPDNLAAFTVYPCWAWAIPGLIWAFGGFRLRRAGPALLVALAWFVYFCAFAEEARSLTRGGAWPDPVWVEARTRGKALRVISLNCEIGDPRAAKEVAAYDPDLVLLEESPSEAEVKSLAESLYGDEGDYAWGGDCSIVARGTVDEEEVGRTPDPHVRLAKVELSNGAKLAVACIRLHPNAFRMDLWSAGCWQTYHSSRNTHEEEVANIKRVLDDRFPDGALLVGGDMNSPAGDPPLRQFEPRLHDVFGDAGRGWGATFHDDFPVVRIDQIWASSNFRAVSLLTKKTKFSDHRMVICDLMVYEK